MRLSSMFLVVLFCSGSFAAGASNLLYVQPPASQDCPVGFSADRKAHLQSRSTGSSATQPSLGFEVNFTNSAKRVLVKADILVHGTKTTGREGLIPAGPASVSRNSTESIQVSGTPDAPLLHSLVLTKKMTAVSWLELTHLEYADGGVWQASAESRCIAAPNLYLPVTASPR